MAPETAAMVAALPAVAITAEAVTMGMAVMGMTTAHRDAPVS